MSGAGRDQIVEAGGQVHTARARVAGHDHIEIQVNPAISDVSEVRYAWRNWVEPPANLHDASGLPAEPFLLPMQPTGGRDKGSRGIPEPSGVGGGVCDMPN